MHPKAFLVCFGLAILVSTSHGSVGGYICSYTREKFLKIITETLHEGQEDLSNIYHATNSLKLLNAPGVTKLPACRLVETLFKPDLEIDNLFYAIGVLKLSVCETKLSIDVIVKRAQDILQSDKSPIASLHYGALLLGLLKQQIPYPHKVAQFIQAQLKTDDSLLNLGHALHLASLLGNPGKFITERIEDIVIQADEVDGTLLQWEGGLSTTSLIISGLLKFPDSKPLNRVQADKLANYLLSRVTVQTTKGISALLEAATALATSKVSPISIAILGSSSVTLDKPNLRVQVSNILGRELASVPRPVVAQSATRIAEDVVVLSKQPLSPGASETEFILPLKLEPGYYKILLNAGSESTTLTARVLGPVQINSFEIGVSDADGSAAPRLEKVNYPNKLGRKLQGDSGQNLLVKFALSRAVHQAFIRLSSGKKEIIFVAGQEPNNQYKVEADLGQELPLSDNFDIELIIGDSIITNPFRWDIGEIEVKISNAPASAPAKTLRGSKPEIRHMFRQPDKRPAKTVSLLFTVLTAAPFLVLLVLWGKIGVNLGNFSALAVPFHLGFGAILSLFTLFWLKLDMFTTCAWLIPVGGFTFFAGHRLLSHMARSKKDKSDK